MVYDLDSGRDESWTDVEFAQVTAMGLHKGVVYGGGLSMTDQVFGTAENINKFYSGPHKESVETAAYLSKSWETKRLNENSIVDGRSVFGLSRIATNFNSLVARIVGEISSEPPEKENQTKLEQWKEKAEWAKGLSKEAQAVLLAEKLQNFIVSRDKPNEKKAPAWHIEYYNTRMIMVDAIKDASPELYQQCVKVAGEGIAKQTVKQKMFDNGRNK